MLPLERNFRQVLSREPAAGEVAPARVSGEAVPRAAPDWAEEEFGAAGLGDERLRRRLLHTGARLCRAAAGQSAASLRQQGQDQGRLSLFGSSGESRWRRYSSPITRPPRQRVAGAGGGAGGAGHHFSQLQHAPADCGAGSDRHSATARGAVGLVLHDTMVYNLERTPLGLIDVQCWARDGQEKGKAQRRYELPIEHKESYKWLRSFAAAAGVQRQCPNSLVVSVGDREADIYELFAQAQHRGAGCKLLVRACHPRLLAQEQGPLWEYVSQQPLAGHSSVNVPRRDQRPARVALLEVRFAAVQLRAPVRKAGLGEVALWAVRACETNPPAGVQALDWTLLTTLAVTSLLNDGAFRAERAAGADRYGRRDGLQDRHARGNAAAVEQHRFHGFRNAVALDFRCAVLGHYADDEAADGGSDDDHPAEVIVLRAREVGRPAMEEEKIGEQADQLVEREGDDAGDQADRGGEERDQ